jgi:undecaprenyl-diphosphatase
METLQYIDQELFRDLNTLHSPFFDSIMLFITGRTSWIPFYILIIFFLFRNFGLKQGFIYLFYILAAVGLSDFITSGLMKPFFERLRPCHNQELSAWIHTVGTCGGKYGFASSHASNTFALATGLTLLYPRFKYVAIIMLFWAIIVSYSRIYVGVHYPGDLLTGSFVGISVSFLLYFLLKKFNKTKIQ